MMNACIPSILSPPPGEGQVWAGVGEGKIESYLVVDMLCVHV